MIAHKIKMQTPWPVGFCPSAVPISLFCLWPPYPHGQLFHQYFFSFVLPPHISPWLPPFLTYLSGLNLCVTSKENFHWLNPQLSQIKLTPLVICAQVIPRFPFAVFLKFAIAVQSLQKIISSLRQSLYYSFLMFLIRCKRKINVICSFIHRTSMLFRYYCILNTAFSSGDIPWLPALWKLH